MDAFNLKSVAVVVAFCFLVYSIAGCGNSNEATRHLDKYDDLPYSDIMTLDVPKEAAYKAAVAAFQERGYVITLSDPQTGLINAEINSPAIILEEQKEIQHAGESEGPSAGTILLAILGIVLIFGIVIWLAGLSKDKKDEETSTTKTTTSTPSTTYVTAEPSKTISYKYTITLNASALSDTSTELQISAVKMEMENGAVKGSRKFESKYLNYSVFDAVYERLFPPLEEN